MVQSDNVPLKVWHDISSALTEAGHSGCSWQACRERFSTMNTYFKTSMLKAKGQLFGSKWSHYDSFCRIHDIPIDYEYCAVEEDHDEAATSELWDPYALDLLVTLYKERRSQFIDSKSTIRHSILYNEIASTTENMHKTVSGKQCKDKISKMLDTFRKEFDAQKKTGQAPSTWPWYSVFLEMEEGRATLNAPCSFSVGSLAQYSVQGQKMKPAARACKERPPTASNDDDMEDLDDPPTRGRGTRKSGAKKPLFVNNSKLYQQAKLENDREIIQEIKLWREQQSTQGMQRTSALQDIAASLKAFLPPKD